jgi:THO complex subunit 2
MEIRNALIVLTRIVKVFPVTKRVAATLEKRVTPISKQDEKEDLKIVAMRYYVKNFP